MKNFLRGTLGVYLQAMLIILGILSIVASFMAGQRVGTIVLLVFGILCFCVVAGIRHWLGRK
jgi:c-di-AMP phosphodiesterase-like protein